MHADATPYPPPRRRSSCNAVIARRAPDAPSGCPNAMAPPCGLSGVCRSDAVHLAQTRNDLRRKGFVDLHDREIVLRRSPARSNAFGIANAGPMPMISGSNADDARRNQRAEPRDAVGLRLTHRRQHDRRRAVGDAAGIAGRHDAVFGETCRQACRASPSRVRRAALRLFPHERSCPAGRELPPARSLRQSSRLACAASARSWLASANSSHSCARNAVLFGEIFRGDRHRRIAVRVGQRRPERIFERHRLTEIESLCARRARRAALGSYSRCRPRARRSASPSRSVAAAERIACRPEPHKPIDGQRGTPTGKPARNPTWRAKIDGVGATLNDVAEDHLVDALARHAAAANRFFGGNDGEIGRRKGRPVRRRGCRTGCARRRR